MCRCVHGQGMEAYGVRAFAEALEVVPSTLAENAGLNPIEIVTELRNRHARGETAAGINVRKVSTTASSDTAVAAVWTTPGRLLQSSFLALLLGILPNLPRPCMRRALSATCWMRTWCSRSS